MKAPYAEGPVLGPTEPASPAMRLYVEQDGAGAYVYRLVEAVSGRLVGEFGRADADCLAEV